MGSAPRLSRGALNPDIDWISVEEKYLGVSPNVVSVDDFLSKEAS